MERWPTCMILVKVESIHLLQRFVEGMDESPLSVGLLYGFVFFFQEDECFETVDFLINSAITFRLLTDRKPPPRCPSPPDNSPVPSGGESPQSWTSPDVESLPLLSFNLDTPGVNS